MIIEKFANKQYKFGCVLSVYNRPDKVAQTIQSLRESYIPDDFLLVIVDDGSDISVDLNVDFLNHVIIRKNKNYGISHTLVMGWDFIYNMNIPYMINLDSDVVVSRNWLSKILNVHKLENEPHITTGFNGKYHKIIETNSKFHIKNSIGGVNLFFDRNLYETIRPCLTKNPTIPQNVINNMDLYGENPKLHNLYKGWDWGLMAICDKKNIKKLCCNPSVVQHMGDVGLTSNPNRFEQCVDFENHCIPKIIHQTWKNHNIPERLKLMQKTVIEKHPDYEYMFWTDADIEQFIKKEYPKVWDFYNSFTYIIQKIDFARLLFLYHFGGVYLDLDSYCYKNMDEILKFPVSLCKVKKHPDFSDSYSVILNNAFIAAEKQNLFIRNVLQNIINYEHVEDYSKYYTGYVEYAIILKSTGPLMITDSYSNYEFKDMINLLDENFYFGVSNINHKENLLDMVNYKKNINNLNENLNNIISENSNSDYHFLHIHESSWWKIFNIAIPPIKNVKMKDCNKKEVKL